MEAENTSRPFPTLPDRKDTGMSVTYSWTIRLEEKEVYLGVAGKGLPHGKMSSGCRLIEIQEQKPHRPLASYSWMMSCKDMLLGAAITTREVQELTQRHKVVNSLNHPCNSLPLDFML